MAKKQVKNKKKTNSDVKAIREVQDALRVNINALRSTKKLTINELRYAVSDLTESMLELWIRFEKIFVFFSPEEEIPNSNQNNHEIYT